MTSFSWKIRKAIIVLTSLMVVVCILCLVYFLSQPLSINEGPNSFVQTPVPLNTKPQRPTALEIQSASEFKLQRIKKPAPITPVASEMVSPPPTLAITYMGKLLGTLVDSEPMESYALLNLDSSIVKLVKLDEFVDPPINVLKLVEVHAESIILKHGPSGQTLVLEVEH